MPFSSRAHPGQAAAMCNESVCDPLWVNRLSCMQVTIDFLHYFLDGVLAGVEKEQGGGVPPASGRTSRNSRERFSTARSSARS